MGMITIGADPEVFVKDGKTGDIETSWGVVKGSKDKPFKTKHGFLHRDNVLAEMNVDPASSASQFATNVQAIMGDLSSMLAKSEKEISIISSNMMDIKYLTHYEAARFGCNTNLNCWDIDKPHKPSAEEAGELRTASGHIHIGCDFEDAYDQISLAKACEVYIGLPSIAFDQDSLRRTLYGKAGSFRPKPYGVEYTVPSNFWLKNKELMKWVFGAAEAAVVNRKHLHITDVMGEKIQDTINTCNQQQALALCNEFGVSYPQAINYV